MNTSTICKTCGKTIPELPEADAYCVACRYDSPVKSSSFTPNEYDIACDTVAATVVDDFDHEPDAPGDERQETIARFLRLLSEIGDATRTGQVLIVLAYLAGQTRYSTHAELAHRLNISPGRISQIMAAIPRDFGSMTRLKRRTAKARPTCEGTMPE